MPLREMSVLVTGAAGFIGSFVAQRLLRRGDAVIGFDNLNAYYDVSLKQARLERLRRHGAFRFVRGDLGDRNAMTALFAVHRPRRIVHLAAQAGVRHSLQAPHAYADANLIGFLNLLEAARRHGTEHLVYASTSSVYGNHANLPFSARDNADHPVSLYAATKRANELMAHAYSHLFDIPATGLRFFTVYGPWGRPDMALFAFTRRMVAGEPIDVHGDGEQRRDFTYIDDAAEAVVRILDRPATPSPAWSGLAPDAATSAAPWRIYNVGGGVPVTLARCIELLEAALGCKALRNPLPAQPGDMAATHADAEPLAAAIGYRPHTPVETGIERFVEWYRRYYANAAAPPP